MNHERYLSNHLISCKLGELKDGCADLGAQLGISRNRMICKVFSVLQGRARGKTYRSNHFLRGKKEVLPFLVEEIITDLEIFLSFEMSLSPTF